MRKLHSFLIAICFIAVTQLSAAEYVTFAKQGKLWHLIDGSGTIISEEPMTKVMKFFNGYASCVINSKWHYIDQTGKTFTVNLDIDKLYVFHEGLGAFMTSKRWGFMNEQGEVVIEPAYEAVKMFRNGKCWVKQNASWFQIDTTGKSLFEKGFVKFHPFVNGIARVRFGDYWGYINEKGESLAGGFIYTDIADFVEEKTFAKKGDLWGIIDKEGNFIVDPIYNKVWHFNKNGYSFVRKDDEMGILDANWTELAAPKYSKILDYKEGFCGARVGDLWDVIDRKGNVIYKNLGDFTKFQEGYAVISEGEQKGLLTTTGEIKLLGKYDRIKPFVNGYALVYKGDLWGYINTDLEEVIVPQFLNAYDFQAEWTTVETTKEYLGYINRQGELVIPDKFDRANAFVRNKQVDADYGCNQNKYINSGFSSMFSSAKNWFVKADMEDTEVARIKYGGEWGFINKQGDFILSDLDNAETWVNGFTKFRKNGLWGFIDKNGKIVVEPQFQSVFDMTKVCE